MAALGWTLWRRCFGTGTQRMIDLLQQAGLPEPEFESEP
jgi:predicted HTH transcriptional regulator